MQEHNNEKKICVYTLYEEYLVVSKDTFKAKQTNKDFRRRLDLFRTYVKKYKKKQQHKTYEIEYDGKVMSMTKWRKSTWNIYTFSFI